MNHRSDNLLTRSDMEALLDVERAAELLGISPWTVRKWLSTNKLKSVRLGRRVLIEPGEIRRIVDAGRDQPAYRSPGADR